MPEVTRTAFARRRHLAAAVAEHIAVSVANLNLRESLRSQAVRDPLTGLYNRRYMQEFLDRELHSARRKQRPLAVMMLDLDHFKRYNDNFGHSAGDQALAAVGETLLRWVRAEDVACRYGGEEFTLILPECSLQQATVRAEEIRKRSGSPGPRDGQAASPSPSRSESLPSTKPQIASICSSSSPTMLSSKPSAPAAIASSLPAPPPLPS